MKINHIPFKTTSYFSELICDYLDENSTLRPFYHRFPDMCNFKEQIKEKVANFSEETRLILNKSLEKQYKGLEISKKTTANINFLKASNTFTVVTGHQLNLFTGPLYFLYKIITAINLAKELKKVYPECNFIPVYWMATEDYDFDEINYFNYKNKKIRWNKEVSGAVGKLNNSGLEIVFDIFSKAIGNNKNAEVLKGWFKKGYLDHNNLTEATRYLANTLFGDYGLVIVDGDDRALKELLIPYVKKDLLYNITYNKVMETILELEKLPRKYGVQVNPREINYFYLKEDIRERIIEKEGRFYVNKTEIEFSRDEILVELENNPERFSPNVICRPLYQEVILPNLCYIGGGGEIAYWLELKKSFEAMNVTFPMLLLRNSALVISGKQKRKLEKLNISIADLFLKQHSFINKKIREISDINIDFSKQKSQLQLQFKELYELATQTEKSFFGAVKAQEKKQLKGLDNLEKRLLKAQKRKLKDHIVRITEIQDELFPSRSLQERNLNFSELYLEYGEMLIPYLIQTLKPLHRKFSILEIN